MNVKAQSLKYFRRRFLHIEIWKFISITYILPSSALSPAFAPQGGASRRQASGERGRVRGKFQIFLFRFEL